MKKALCLIAFAISISFAYPQSENVAYMLRFRSITGLSSDFGYIYHVPNEYAGLKRDLKSLPDSSDPSYAFYEWYFIPVGTNEPGLYYIRNGNGQYLGYPFPRSNYVGLFDSIDDAFKFFINKINFSTSNRFQNNTLRIYTQYQEKLQYIYAISGSGIGITQKTTDQNGGICLEPSSTDNWVFNGNMELVSHYAVLKTPPAPPQTAAEDFSPNDPEQASSYFPYDYTQTTTSRSRLIHSNALSGGGTGDGYYFIRMRPGDVVRKVVDNPEIQNSPCQIKLRIKVRATQMGDGVATMKLVDTKNDQEFSFPLSVQSSWSENEYLIPLDKLGALSVLEISNSMNEGELLDIDDIAVSLYDDTEVSKQMLYWLPESYNTDWNNPDNWKDENGNQGYSPDKTTSVVIRNNEIAYPILNEGEANQASHIYFENRAQLGNQFFLDYDSAHIQLDLKAMQWYAFSAPLKGMYSGDYQFAQCNPLTEIKLFRTENPSTGVAYSEWTSSFSTMSYLLKLSEPYSIRVGQLYYSLVDENGADPDSREIITDATLNLPQWNTAFSFYDEFTKKKTGKEESISSDSRKWSHRFIYEIEDDATSLVPDGDVLLSFPTGVSVGEEIVMVGNPFMAGLNFGEFYKANYRLINPEFKLLIGNDYITYSGEDQDGDGVLDSGILAGGIPDEGIIPPMTSFAVTTKSDYSGDDLLITKSMNRVCSNAQQRVQSNTQIPSLSLELMQGNASSKALILFSDSYANTYSAGEDSRKMNLKENKSKLRIYTIVEDKSIEVNRLKDIDAPLAIGIESANEGQAMIRISGINTIPTDLILFDVETNTKTLLSGNEVTYTFDTKKGIFIDRFYIYRQPATVSIPDIFAPVFIQTTANTIRITSINDNLQEIHGYDLRGNLLFRERNMNSNTKTINLDPMLRQHLIIVKIQTTSAVISKKLLVK